MRTQLVVAICVFFAYSLCAFAQNVILFRHGEADHNLSKTYNSRVTTRPPSALTEVGKKQVEESALKLKAQGYDDEKVSKIFVSPLLRTRQTADIIIKILKLNPRKKVIEPLLIEPDMGALEGKSLAQTKSYFPRGDDWNKSWARSYGGETNEDVYRRLETLVDKLRKIEPRGDVILVTHGSPAAVLLSILSDPQSGETRLKTAEFRIVPLK